jgi:hypothetical protein
MKQRQWQEVFTIVRKYQKNMLGASYDSYDRSEYEKLTKILNELEPYAYGENQCKI